MTEAQIQEFKNLLRYQCKALDAIKESGGKYSERIDFLHESARLQGATLEVMRSHTRSLALNLRGIMVLIRLAFWLIALNLAGSGAFLIFGASQARDESAQAMYGLGELR